MECGNKRCPPFAFCHEASNACQPCAAICDPQRPAKYESALCLEQCREYIMSEQLRGGSSVDGTARVLGGVGLALGALALGLLLLLCYCVHRRPRLLLKYLQSKVDVEAPGDVKAKMSANNNKGDIGLDNSSSVCTVSGSVRSLPLGPPSTLSTLALPQPLGPAAVHSPALLPPLPPARHPSEDSTLDYAAYDNPALSPSSSPLPPSAPGSAGSKAMDAVLDAVLDHATLPGAVTDLHRGLHNGLANGNGSVARMESSF